jgi:hypothetical protein
VARRVRCGAMSRCELSDSGQHGNNTADQNEPVPVAKSPYHRSGARHTIAPGIVSTHDRHDSQRRHGQTTHLAQSDLRALAHRWRSRSTTACDKGHDAPGRISRHPAGARQPARTCHGWRGFSASAGIGTPPGRGRAIPGARACGWTADVGVRDERARLARPDAHTRRCY